MLFFEPPTICRWETVDETKASLKLESKQNENGPIAKKSVVAMPSVQQKRPLPTKIVEDFDILDIPSHVDLSGLMRDFFMPNVPDGYTIKMLEKFAGGTSAIQSIKDILCETNSPRWLFPKRAETRPLQIVGRASTSDEHTGQSTYMFSQLLNDLNELWEQQQPFFERQIDEKSEMLSMSLSDGRDTFDAESEPNFKDMSFLRAASDYPFSFLSKKEETIDETQIREEDESEEDSIDIDDDMEIEDFDRFDSLHSIQLNRIKPFFISV